MIATPYVESFLELAAKVTDAGLMRRRPGFYLPRILFWSLGMVITLVAVTLAGDGWYGGDDRLMHRQALHCDFCRFIHPVSGETVEITAPPDADFLAAMQQEFGKKDVW